MSDWNTKQMITDEELRMLLGEDHQHKIEQQQSSASASTFHPSGDSSSSISTFVPRSVTHGKKKRKRFWLL